MIKINLIKQEKSKRKSKFFDFKKSELVYWKKSTVLNYLVRPLIERIFYGKSNLEKYISGLEKQIEKLNRKLNYEKKMHRINLEKNNEALDLFMKEFEGLESEKKVLEKKLDNNYDVYEEVLTSVPKKQFQVILSSLEIPTSKMIPKNKICGCSLEHHAAKNYSDFLKKLSRNNYVLNIMSAEGRSMKGYGVKVQNIIDDCLKILYYENNFATLLLIKTTTKNKLANIIITEIIKEYI